jgi:hypothetical protein
MEKRTAKIYLVENCYNNSNKVYIGKTINSRKYDHKKTYGDGIKYTIIDETDGIEYEKWEPLESYWIEQFKQWGFEIMNIRMKGGSGPLFHTLETKTKMSKPKPNTSEALKGIPKPSVSEALKGISRPYVSKKFKGVKLTEEHIENLKKGHSKKDKSFYKSEKWLSCLKKPICQYNLNGDFIAEWTSVTEAAIILKIGQPNISSCLSGKQKTAYKYVWKYKE